MDLQCSVSPTVEEYCSLFGHHHQIGVLPLNWIFWVLEGLCASPGYCTLAFLSVKLSGWFGSHAVCSERGHAPYVGVTTPINSFSYKSLLTLFQMMLLLFQFQRVTLAMSLCSLKLTCVNCLTFWTFCSLAIVQLLSQNLLNYGLTGKYLMNLPCCLPSASIWHCKHWDGLFKNLFRKISDSTSFTGGSLVAEFLYLQKGNIPSQLALG